MVRSAAVGVDRRYIYSTASRVLNRPARVDARRAAVRFEPRLLANSPGVRGACGKNSAGADVRRSAAVLFRQTGGAPVTDITPTLTVNGAPVLMTVGEPQDPPPAFVTDIIAAQGRDFGRFLRRRHQRLAPCCRRVVCATLRLARDGGRCRDFRSCRSCRVSRGSVLRTLCPGTQKQSGRPPGGTATFLVPGSIGGSARGRGRPPITSGRVPKTGTLPDFESVSEKSVLARTVAAFFCHLIPEFHGHVRAVAPLVPARGRA